MLTGAAPTVKGPAPFFSFAALMLFKKGLPRGTCTMALEHLWPLPELYSWAQTGITYPFYDVALIRRSKEIDADLGFI